MRPSMILPETKESICPTISLLFLAQLQIIPILIITVIKYMQFQSIINSSPFIWIKFLQ